MDALTSEQNLVRKAQSGERRAFDALIRKYRDGLMAVCRRYMRNPADAEDAVQITLMRAYRGLQYFRGDSAFYSWLHRIAINSATTLLWLRAREEALFVRGIRTEENSGAAPLLKVPDTPEDFALANEIVEVVQRAIESLVQFQRTAIVLHELEGMSYAEVAVAMSCPIGTVRSRVFRAREAIDAQLRSVYDEGLGRGKQNREGSLAQTG